MGNYSMPRYFQNMPVVGKPVKVNAENVAELRAIEDDIHAHVVEGLNNGKADEAMNAKGQLTAMQRIALLVDPGTWCPLNSLYNPEHNKTGTTSIVKGLGRVNGNMLPTTRSMPALGCPARRTTCSADLTPPSVCASP